VLGGCVGHATGHALRVASGELLHVMFIVYNACAAGLRGGPWGLALAQVCMQRGWNLSDYTLSMYISAEITPPGCSH
jgi:hypothetical protein